MPTAVSLAQASEPLRRLRQRDAAELLVDLAVHLAEPDRALIEHVYRHGRPLTEAAPLARQSPRTLQRRLSRTVRRMLDPRFRQLAYQPELLPDPLRHPARQWVLEGRSLREAARLSAASVHRVRQDRTAIDAIFVARGL